MLYHWCVLWKRLVRLSLKTIPVCACMCVCKRMDLLSFFVDLECLYVQKHDIILRFCFILFRQYICPFDYTFVPTPTLHSTQLRFFSSSLLEIFLLFFFFYTAFIKMSWQIRLYCHRDHHLTVKTPIISNVLFYHLCSVWVKHGIWIHTYMCILLSKLKWSP